MMNYFNYWILIILFFLGSCLTQEYLYSAQDRDHLAMIPILLAQGNMPPEMRNAKKLGYQLACEFRKVAHDLNIAIQHLEQWNVGYSCIFFGKIKYFEYTHHSRDSEQSKRLEAIFAQVGSWKTWEKIIRDKFAKIDQAQLVNDLIVAFKQKFLETVGSFASNNEARLAIKHNLSQNQGLEANVFSDGFAFVCSVNEFVKCVNEFIDPCICKIL